MLRHLSPAEIRLVSEVPLVGLLDACSQADAGLPSQRRKFRYVEQLARRPVGLAGVESQLALVADDLANQSREFADGDVLAGPGVQRHDARVVAHGVQ